MPKERTISLGLYKHFYLRSRYVDQLLVALAALAIIPFTDIFWVCVAILFGIGTWLIFGAHRSMRVLPKHLLVATLVVAGYALLNGAFDLWTLGDLAKACEPFPLFFIVLCPLMVGMVLVRQPLKWLVIGARAAIVAIFLYACYLLIESRIRRYGFETNAALAAYLILVLAVVSRFKLKPQSPAWSGKAFFYLAVPPLMFTSTRVAVFLMALTALFDFATSLRKITTMRGIVVHALGVLCLVIAGFIISGWQDHYFISRTWAGLTSLFEGGSMDESLSVRVSLWTYGLGQFLENPIFGAGICSVEQGIWPYLQENAPSRIPLFHLHNMYIDLLASYGLVGLVLVLGIHGFILNHLLKGHMFDATEKSAIVILFLVIAVYGITGSYLTDGRMTVLTIFVFAVLLSEHHRRAMREKLSSVGGTPRGQS